MKPWGLLVLVALSLPAHATILITSFDAFSGGRGNNSRIIAENLMQRLSPEMEISHCELTTAFDYATEQIAECMNQLGKTPKLIISLGEGGCGKLKLETVAKNWATSIGTDNRGQSRSGEVIIEGAPERLGLNIDWSQPFCNLDYNSQKSITLASSDAQAFVCNNTMYRMSYQYSHIPFGFIHVPAHGCARRRQKIPQVTGVIASIIRDLNQMEDLSFTPYNTDKVSLQAQRERSSDECERDFLRRLLTTY